MSRSKRVYLAGPIDERSSSDAADWREYAETMLIAAGDTPLNPLRWEDKARDIRQIVEFDKAAISKCDIVLANCSDLGKPGIPPLVGTLMEIIWAWEHNKIVVTVVDPAVNRGWLDYHSHKVFSELDKALEYITNSNRWF